MSWIRLILRNLWFYRKQNLAVLAGIAISTSVLTGALIVGDSVRFSLQRQTDHRLGATRYVMQPGERFFRQGLAGELSHRLKTPVVTALQSGGIAINSDKKLRINQVQVVGIDIRFAKLWDQPLQVPGADEAIVSRNVAAKLNLKQGDEILLRVQKQGKAPLNAPFVSEKGPSVSIRLKVSAIADDARMGRFSLKNNQAAPYNIFVSLNQLASLLGLSGYANILLAADGEKSALTPAMLDSTLKVCWKPADAGLVIRKLPDNKMFEIISDRIFFEDSASRAILSAVPGCESILTYLANSVSSGTRSTPYSFVTAASDNFLKQNTGERQIIISDWLAKDLGIGTGDSVMLRYFLMGPLRSLREDSTRFKVISVLPPKNSLSDPWLMPDFPGMSDAGNCRDWETGAPVDLKKIRGKDEQYWKDFRGTPKAFISIGTGQKIWGNRFGNYTAFRFDARESDLPGIERSLMSKLRPAQYGLSFRPAYEAGQLAARNSTDFGELFLSLSFFILLSALLLTAMLYSLLARMRLKETGIFSVLGFRKQQILGILLGEAFLVTIAGVVAGTLGGILYNYLMVLGLNTIWQDAVNTSLLVMKIKPVTLLIGATTGMVTSLTTLLFILWKNLRKQLSILVKSNVAIQSAGIGKTSRIWNITIAVVSIGISFLFMLWLLITGNAPDSSFSLVAGGCMLAGGIALVNLFLVTTSQKSVKLIPGFLQLTFKNLSLQRIRTLSAVSLLSLGTFTIIITGANRKTSDGQETTRHSGTGGFLLWAESTLPIMNDLNSDNGARTFGIQDEEMLKPVHFVQFSSLDGDDASCLNLNQVSQPGLLGIPADQFNLLNAFTFTKSDSTVDKAHPWKALKNPLAPDVITGFADQTVITWGLRKSVGDTLFYRDESGRGLKIKLVGAMENSIFQGHVLVSDSLLRLYYPASAGSRFMLIDGPANQRDAIIQRLETIFQDYGLMVTPASDRLASFHEVENTYLSVFMMLGGLGVLIGTVGLGIVLLRNISERKKELAIYLVFGFHKQFVFKLMLAEHLLILSSGICLGLISAIPVIVPSLISPHSPVPWLFITCILTLILINGFLWMYFSAKRIFFRNLLDNLREE